MEKSRCPQTPGNGSHQVRPPCQEAHASIPGVSDHRDVRATAVQRDTIFPTMESSPSKGVDATHNYVRRYWIPIIGPGAVADLLRLTAAAKSGRSLPEPTHLASLLRLGLAHRSDGTVVLPTSVRRLDDNQIRRLPPPLRRTHPAPLLA